MSSKHPLQTFEPDPGTLYDLDTTARLTGLSRRRILIYCREKLIQPMMTPPHEAMMFSDELILRIRRIDQLYTFHGADLQLIRTIINLVDEVRRLQAEVRRLRRQ